jgi:two-component system sensor histidine kinase RpfC
MRRLRALLDLVPDNEHEMAFNRLLFGTAGAVFVLAHRLPGRTIGLAASVYLALACAIVLDVLIRRRRSVARRSIAIVADMMAISIALSVGGEAAGLFYPLYLWAIFGNGFRFGMRYLLAATLCAIAGFVGVLCTSVFWQSVPATSLGLLAALAILPPYAGVLIRKLSRATRHAEEASRAKSMFLASVSHEFRTPLNAIVASVALLGDTALDGEQRALAASLNSGTRRLLDLINAVLDFSRLDAGRMPVEPVAFALTPLLADVTTLLKPQARSKGLRLGVHLAPDVPDTLFADRRHLHEILINLVGNGVKFTEAGTVTIRIEPRAAAEGRVGLSVSVTDTGIGIKPAARRLIFESFTQADGSIIDRFGGTGLGLAICRRLVLLMGGEIDVESTPGQGSRFWFTLDTPRCAPDAAMVEDNAAGCVLLVDDPGTRRRAAAQAASLGPVSFASGIEEAVRCATASRPARIVVLQRDHPAALAADAEALTRLDPTRDLGCVLIVGAGADTEAAATRDAVAGFVDAGVPRDLPDGELARAIGRAVALHRTMERPLAEEAKRPPLRALEILVADDNAINRQVLAKVLERAGHRATLVCDGDQALEALAPGGFDLVLMDVNMPVLNGLDAARLHRLSETGPDRLPILALTADPTETMRARCLEAGMDLCLGKPIEPDRLVAQIEAMVPGTRRETAQPAPETAVEPPALARLADHPRFRAALPPLDRQVTDALLRLGGAAFVAELLAGFQADATMLIARLSQAAGDADMPAFRDHLHALRSIAANVGARALHEAIGEARGIDSATLGRDGPDLARRLQRELERFGRAVPSSTLPQRAP